jgi:NAD(P)-dependent dehydrogenase (short-subunit alcohol dehydrogenase family)
MARGGVVVTGAARGIGAAIARQFAGDGIDVVGLDLDGERLAETVAALPGGNNAAVVGDARDPGAVKEACDAAAGAGGGIHAFVANAGMARPGDASTYPKTDWDLLVDVNLTSSFVGAQGAYGYLRDGGSVVMISSINGHLGFAGRAAYCAAKAGVQGLVRALAVEWAPDGIRVNAVSPGTVVTELQKEFIATGFADPRKFERRIPMRRMGEPEDVATVVAFLASAGAGYVTGVTIPVDGGWLATGMDADG